MTLKEEIINLLIEDREFKFELMRLLGIDEIEENLNDLKKENLMNFKRK